MTTSAVCMISGKKMNDAPPFFSPASFASVPPRIIAPITSAAIDSKTSAMLPAQSPTLSPTWGVG